MATYNRTYSVSDDNGCIFDSKYYIPEEVLAMILSYLSPQDLVFTCRLVCKYWCNVVDTQVWRIKNNRENLPPFKDLPWYACYWILVKNPFKRNFARNGCGQEGLKHWNIVENKGDKWKIEKSPVGIRDFPKDLESEEIISSCFATSFSPCSKEQIIDLKKEGAVPQIMDLLQPKITVSEWWVLDLIAFCHQEYHFYCHSDGQSFARVTLKFSLLLQKNLNSMLSIRRYCGMRECNCVYEFKSAILDEHQNPVDEFEMQKKLEGADLAVWKKVTHTFQNYGQNVRYVWIYHSGVDSLYWKGHYGSKMTGSSVVLHL